MPKSFILCLFSLQKFEAYDSSGAVVAGDKDKEVIQNAYWFFFLVYSRISSVYLRACLFYCRPMNLQGLDPHTSHNEEHTLKLCYPDSLPFNSYLQRNFYFAIQNPLAFYSYLRAWLNMEYCNRKKLLRTNNDWRKTGRIGSSQICVISFFDLIFTLLSRTH